jgi:hypothetical protein
MRGLLKAPAGLPPGRHDASKPPPLTKNKSSLDNRLPQALRTVSPSAGSPLRATTAADSSTPMARVSGTVTRGRQSAQTRETKPMDEKQRESKPNSAHGHARAARRRRMHLKPLALHELQGPCAR